MFSFTKIFSIREPVEEEYQVPAMDVLDDAGGVLILPPPAPILISVHSTGIEWETTELATGYYVENLSSGTIWGRIGTVSQPVKLQMVWNFTEWDINVWSDGAWVTLYRSARTTDWTSSSSLPNPDVPTPDQAPSWVAVPVAVPGAAPLPVVRAGSPFGLGGMTISGAGDSRANSAFILAGILNGKSYYSSPEVAQFDFTPATHVFYRVRGFNSAGTGAPSNSMILDESYGESSESYPGESSESYPGESSESYPGES
jgi:hypothetical protein